MEYAARLKIPALVIRGDRSVHLTPEDAVKLTALAKAPPAVVIRNAQHNVMLDNPDEVAHSLRQFLAGLASSGPAADPNQDGGTPRLLPACALLVVGSAGSP